MWLPTLANAYSNIDCQGLYAGDRQVKRQHLTACVAAFSVLAVGAWFLTTATQHSPRELHAGDEVYAVDPNIVSELVYESPERKLVATRPGSESEFKISISDSKGRTLEECPAGSLFSETLATLRSIKVKRALSEAEAARLRASRASDIARLRIADATALEPMEYRALIAGPDLSVLFFDERSGFESTVPALSMEHLKQGCAVLGARKSL
jgi:hypothetical protein